MQDPFSGLYVRTLVLCSGLHTGRDGARSIVRLVEALHFPLLGGPILAHLHALFMIERNGDCGSHAIRLWFRDPDGEQAGDFVRIDTPPEDTVGQFDALLPVTLSAHTSRAGTYHLILEIDEIVRAFAPLAVIQSGPAMLRVGAGN